MKRSHLLLLFQTTSLLSITSGFIITRKGTSSFGERALLSTNDANNNLESTSIAEMTPKQIQSELLSLGIFYKDCFDKESLVKRLRDVRNSATKHNDDQQEGVPQTKQNGSAVVNNDDTTKTTTAEAALLDKEALKAELRKLRVSELRSKLGEQGIRWSNMIEKEDLVNALLSNMESIQDFSKSKSLIPGKVNEVTGDILSAELSSESSNPLLLDVFATWCGPCQFVAPQLEAASKEFSNTVRVAKIDSDKFPDWSSKLKIGAFPTLILFSKEGKEINRVEGALTRDQILDFVNQSLTRN